MFLDPLFDDGMFVGGVVVDDQMQIQARRSLAIHLAQELQKLFVAVAVEALPNNAAIENVERRKESRRSVPNIVMGHGSTSSAFERQSGLITIERLDLRFLVHAEDKSLVGRIQVEANHVIKLFNEVLVVGEFEGAYTVRL